MAQGLPQPGLAWQDRLATGALILCVISTTSWMPPPGQSQGYAFPIRFVTLNMHWTLSGLVSRTSGPQNSVTRYGGTVGEATGGIIAASAQSSAYSMPLCGGMRRKACLPRMWTNVLQKLPPG